MNKVEANKKAQELLGDTAFAIRVSHKDKNQRFGVLLVSNSHAVCAGFGPSYEAALAMAADEVAKLKQKEVQP